MTQEEKARAYDEVLNKLRYFMAIGVDPLITMADVQDFFPELAESEDERIRKGIIRNLEYLMDRAEGFVKDELKERIAWLEKQSKDSTVFSNSSNTGKIEQKPAWSEYDEENLSWFEKFFRAESVLAEGKDIPQDRYLWFKNLKDRVQPQPKQEWSEEDKEIIDYLIDYLENELDSSYTDLDKETFTKEINWLKSLRPKNTWRPSDEQIEALSHMIDAVEDEWDCEEPIGRELLKQLKELRGK